jgi:hypothetical protein
MAQPGATPTDAPALSLAQRFTGVLFSPRPTFESVVARPKWADIFFVCLLITAVVWSSFIFSPVGYQALTDQVTTQAQRGAEQRGQNPAQAVENTTKAMPFIRAVTIGVVFIVPFVLVMAISGILFMVFGAILGGGGTFKQVLAIVAHAGVVQTVAGIFITGLNYVRGTMTSMTNLGVFAQMLPEDSFVVRMLSAIDLVWIWYLIIIAIGLSVLFRRKTASIVISFLSLYLVIAIIIAVIKSAMS